MRWYGNKMLNDFLEEKLQDTTPNSSKWLPTDVIECAVDGHGVKLIRVPQDGVIVLCCDICEVPIAITEPFIGRSSCG